MPRRLIMLLSLCGMALPPQHAKTTRAGEPAFPIEHTKTARAGDPAFAGQASDVWLDVPFVKQEDEGCGAASIAMVIQYWQKQQPESNIANPDPVAIQRVLYSRKAHGIYASDLKRYFHEHSFTTYTFQGTWDDLRHHLEKGRPLLLALKPSPGEVSLHYVVVVGLDCNQNSVRLNDGAQRKLLKEDRNKFEKEWNAGGRWTLLALPQCPGSRR